MWTNVEQSREQYRQIEQRYNQTLGEYKLLEDEYARARDEHPSVATQLYQRLAKKQAEVEDLYKQLTALRTELAETRLPTV